MCTKGYKSKTHFVKIPLVIILNQFFVTEDIIFATIEGFQSLQLVLPCINRAAGVTYPRTPTLHLTMRARWLFWTGFTAEPTIKGSSCFLPVILSPIASREV